MSVGVSAPQPAGHGGGILGAVVAAWRLLLRTVQRVPRAGQICFLLALVNAIVWTVVVPPFEVPDEPAHFAYTQYFAETGKAPPQTPNAGQYSPQEQLAMSATGLSIVKGYGAERAIITPAAQNAFKLFMQQPESPVGPGGTTDATNQPPLYYALSSVPYWLTPSSNVLARLATVRLFSALLVAGTVLLCFLFLREVMPGTRWAWTVGALAVAFQPQVDFIGAGVQGDNMLFFTSAATMLMLVRSYRRGLTSGRAAWLGVCIAAGLLSKITFLGLIPGIALGVLLLGYRAWRSEGLGRAVKLLVITGAVALVPYLIYGILNIEVWHRGSFLAGAANGVSGSTSGAATIAQILEYFWEFYLPRLGFMHEHYFTSYMARTMWLDGFIGHFGWLDYGFPSWVYNYGQYVFYAIGALALVALVRLRRSLKPWLPMVFCFLVIGFGLLAEIADAAVHYYLSTHFIFEQARYLFPLLALYGMMIALAPRALPRRWAPALGGVLVVLAMAHGFFAETITITRYYG